MTRALASRLLALLLVFGGLAFQAPSAHAVDAFTIAPTTLTFPATAVKELRDGRLSQPDKQVKWPRNK